VESCTDVSEETAAHVFSIHGVSLILFVDVGRSE